MNFYTITGCSLMPKIFCGTQLLIIVAFKVSNYHKLKYTAHRLHACTYYRINRIQFQLIPNGYRIISFSNSSIFMIPRLHVVPEFNIDPPMRNVTEPEGMVEICISTNSPLARNVTVIATTGPKIGAANQATGTANCFR